ncbi:unnamed protein product [Onchocerca flexuosa]|uniref:Uncharacterized protein n=1 Tax=Onchocerca flexuosa TaxID=387005 RepID=A0A183I6N6_9BILA|nr:unnamed protein product [Onchocerca flexuosa]
MIIEAISTTLHISSKTDENIEKPKKVHLIIRAKSEERKSIRISDTKNEADLESSKNVDPTIWMDPCPEFDYDARNYGDPFQVPEYAMDIFNYYHQREAKQKKIFFFSLNLFFFLFLNLHF